MLTPQPIDSPRPISWRYALFASTLLLSTMLASVPAMAGGNPPPTDCVNLCGASLPDPCVLTSGLSVTPGSIIDCGSRAVVVQGTSGNLYVLDGKFTLRAGSVSVTSGGTIAGHCTTASAITQGVTIESSSSVTVSTNSKITTSCDRGGGEISITAGTDVSVGGLGIHSDGTVANGPGGSVRISAGGIVGLNDVTATTAPQSSGVAAGGEITVDAGNYVTIGGGSIAAEGHNDVGGSITIVATGDVTTQSSLDADGVTSGDGGTVRVRGRYVQLQSPVYARGAGNSSTGGHIDVDATGNLAILADLTAKGGADGGTISAHALGFVLVGDSSHTSTELNVVGGTGGGCGGIRVAADGDYAEIDGRLKAADGNAGGQGGMITVEGVGVTAVSTSLITADGPSSGSGGTIEVVSRDQTTLSGSLHANRGHALFTYRAATPTVGSGVTGTWSTRQDALLTPPCGDGLFRFGEPCDGANLGEDGFGNPPKTCQTLGYSGGTLACNDNCTFDTSGCTP